ncbi:hypothetical protein R1flu_014772 [Riccia fluitans]|uniref:Uncharacterized protein n=1 Tax=Riccia fluitans TaxID=41844 RepID=A0ABD1YH31_9MARC
MTFKSKWNDHLLVAMDLSNDSGVQLNIHSAKLFMEVASLKDADWTLHGSDYTSILVVTAGGARKSDLSSSMRIFVIDHGGGRADR